MTLNVVVAIVGLFLIWLALRDVFQSVIVPRAADRRLRLSATLTRALWNLWPRVAYRIGADEGRRENFLGTYAPFTMIALFAVWVSTLIVGYGCVFFALRTQLHPQPITPGVALYFAGTSLLTIGFGDVVGTGGLARLVSLAAGASGLGVVAVVTSYLFAVFGAFQRREAFVVTFGARAGAPPSGVGLLVVHAYADIRADLPNVFREGQFWAASVMESHLAYPILVYFRSSHDYESWVGTLGALLDAAVLLMTTIDAEHFGQARILFNVGDHLTHDFAHYFQLPDEATTPGVVRSEFEHACERLSEAGYRLRGREEAWRDFSQLRSRYAGTLNAMARWLEIPPVQWVGDRSFIGPSHARGPTH